jgi:hypothetical protein
VQPRQQRKVDSDGEPSGFADLPRLLDERKNRKQHERRADAIGIHGERLKEERHRQSAGGPSEPRRPAAAGQ